MSTPIQHNVPLAPFTSLKCGGPAEMLVECASREEVMEVLKNTKPPTSPLTGGLEPAREFCPPVKGGWGVRILGYGANTLISDKGLPGLTIIWRGGTIDVDGTTIRVDGGVWWDDLVQRALAEKLWGIELMSGIPSSVAAAIVGNVAAYGQQASDRLVKIEVWDPEERTVRTLLKSDITFGYRMSSLQTSPLIVLSATFDLARESTMELKYASAITVAKELGVNTDTLEGRRAVVMETRRKAGSLYDPNGAHESKTAGSFFKNPIVSPEIAEHIATFDESGKAAALIKQQNAIHGGDSCRVSGAHVLLAAGFTRGQSWGPVRLHPDHVLKIENTGGATAQEIYAVAQNIISTVKEKLNITLEPEVKFLGEFSTS